jgi:UrcA family protein
LKRLNLVTAIIALALVQQLAHATAPTNQSPILTVYFADLDLEHVPGAKVLYQRLKYAAGEVCSSFRGRDIKTKELFGHCVDASMAASIAKIDRPVLTRYYLSITGHDESVVVAKN